MVVTNRSSGPSQPIQTPHASGAQCLVVPQLIQVCSPCNRNFNWLFVCPLHFAALLLSGLPERNDLFSLLLSLLSSAYSSLFTTAVLIQGSRKVFFSSEPPISLSLSCAQTSSQPCFSPRSFCPPCAQSTSASSEARIFFLFPGRDSLTLETMEDRDDRMKLQLLRGRAACMYNPALRTVPRYHLSSH